MVTTKFRTAALMAGLLTLLSGCANWATWDTQQIFPSATGVAIKTVEIKDFNSPGNREGHNISQAIAARLQHEGFVSVIDHRGEGVLSGNMDWGKLDANCWTDTYEYEYEYENENKEKVKEKRTVYTYNCKYRKSLTVSYDLLAHGRRYGNSFTKTYELERSSSKNYDAAKAQLPGEKEINAMLIGWIVPHIIQDISPYNASVTYLLKTGRTEYLKLGIQYTRMGRLDQALSIFEQVANAADDNRVRAAAIYNMGIIHESKGDVDKAFSLYRDANQLDLTEKQYLQAMTRLEEVQARLAELARQTR